MHYSSLHLCFVPCQPHPPWPDHPNHTWKKVQVMKNYTTSYNLISGWSQYSPHHHVLKHILPIFSLDIRD
jgi:hypothetical protein